MRVLVTGATGFIGRHTVARLVEAGHEVRALIRADAARAMRRLPPAVHWHVGDLTQPPTLTGMLEHIDAVVHLAAATAGDWSAQRRATVDGTAALLQACRAADVRRFIHVSSVVVYDVRAHRNGEPIPAEAPLAEPGPALGPYARAKLEAELCVRAAADAGDIDLTIIRPGLVYGPRRVLFEHLGKPLPHLQRRLAYGSPQQRLPFVHVDSVADALARTLDTPATVGQAYNVVDEPDCPRQAYLKLYRELTRQPFRVHYLPVGPLALLCDLSTHLRRGAPATGASGNKLRTRAMSLRYHTDTLTRDTGWTPPRPLHAGLAHALDATPGPDGRPLRVAVVGAGLNAPYHLQPLRAHPHVTIVGLVDAQRDRAEALAKQFNIPLAAESLDTLFEAVRPDVVHLVTPPQTHAALACELMRHGCDVLCEKPLAMSRAQCRQMAQVAREHGRSLAVNHNLWFDPRLVAARRHVAQGAIGEVVHIETFRAFAPRGSTNQPAARAAWLHNLPGGLLEDIAPHAIYTTLGFLGHNVELQQVHCQSTGRRSENPGDDELRLALADGRATAHVTISLNARPDTFTLRVYGTKASLLIDVQNMLVLHQRPGPGPRALDRARQLLGTSVGSMTQTASNAWRLARKRAMPPGTMTPIIREHVQCLIDDRPFPLGPAAGEQVVALLEQIWPRPSSDAPLPARAKDQNDIAV